MLKIVAISLLCSVIILEAFDCQNAGNMIEIKICSNQEFLLEDKELNVVYKEVIKLLDNEGKQKLKNAQKAWIIYRDTKAEFAADFARGGTLAGFLYSKSRIKSTKLRIQELNNILKELGKEY